MKALRIAAYALALQLMAATDAWADDGSTLDCPFGVIVGSETLWRTTMNEARRAARRRWRSKVEVTPLLGSDFADWSLAQQPPIYPESDGYFCRTVRVLGDPWHRCAAWGIPCRLLADSRDARAFPASSTFGRSEMPLELRGTSLAIRRTTPAGACPAGFILTASVTGAGTSGSAVVTLVDGTGHRQAKTVGAEDFQASGDGERVARVDFVREFRAATRRSFYVTATIQGARLPPEARRVSPRTLEVNCRTEPGGATLVQPATP